MLKKQGPFGSMRAMITLSVGLAALWGMTGVATAVGPCCCFCQQGRCSVDVSVKEVDVKGFVIEHEAICIPPLRFPWECGPLKKCGKVRCIKVLSTDKRKEKVCVYDWEAVLCCPTCRDKIKRHRSCQHDIRSCISETITPIQPPMLPATNLDDQHPSAVAEVNATERSSQSSPKGLSREIVAGEIVAGETIVGGTVAGETVAEEPIAGEVSDELAEAISRAEPESDGWVRVSSLPERLRPADAPLAAESALIEVVR